jgi:hypothetical protein
MSEDHDNPHAVPLSQRRVDPAAGKKAWVVWMQQNAGDIARCAAVALVLVVLFGLVAAVAWHKDTLTRKALKTPLQHGTAVVIDKQVQYTDRKMDSRPYLSLKMNGTLVRVYITDSETDKWARTLVGQTVTTSYHSMSGAYFIDDWEPPATKAPISGRLPSTVVR